MTDVVDIKVVERTCDCDSFALAIGEKVLAELRAAWGTVDLKDLKVIVTFDGIVKAEYMQI